MKKSFLFTLLAVLALTTSCVSQKNNSGFAVKPNEVRLEIGMDDLTYLGTVNVEIEYKKYGAITKIYTVNGTNYDPRYFTETTLSVKLPMGAGMLQKALYKVQDTYPDAEFAIPVNHRKEVMYMNGGRIIKETMAVKTYKLK